MRLPIIPPSNLNAEQKPLYDEMRHGIAANFQGFVNVRDDGAPVAPSICGRSANRTSTPPSRGRNRNATLRVNR